MDMLPIITAIISCVTTLAVCLINNGVLHRNAENKQNEIMNLITYKVDTLTKKVEEHNSVILRTYELEKRSSVTEEQIKVINHRIDDLERSK